MRILHSWVQKYNAFLKLNDAASDQGLHCLLKILFLYKIKNEADTPGIRKGPS